MIKPYNLVKNEPPAAGFVGAGLPQLPELAGEAKSYAERLFKFPMVGSLPEAEALKALIDPAAAGDITFELGAAEAVVAYTEGYPYFLQEYGSIGLGYGHRSHDHSL